MKMQISFNLDSEFLIIKFRGISEQCCVFFDIPHLCRFGHSAPSFQISETHPRSPCLPASGGPHPSILFLYMASHRNLVRMISILAQNTPPSPIFKGPLGPTGFLYQKSQHFDRVGEKSRLDNTTDF